ncbi:MAG TPA: hypothetical protein VLF71_03200 [Candidatus Saccharimonadales bacterium]|nr:hypothetical protein [Candidatus Saccharimonadales bacterium]
MAATAEAFVHRPALPLEVAGGLPVDERRWRAVDSIAGLRLAREAARAEAGQILEERIDLIAQGNESAVPRDVDPLSTAARAVDAERRFGAHSPEYRTARESLAVDSRRYLGEWRRRRAWEYFSEVEQPYDEAAGGYTFMGRPLANMVRDGLTPLSEQEETDRRVNDFMEEHTYAAMRSLGHVAVGNLVLLQPGRMAAEAPGAPEARIITIHECPDWAIDMYNHDPKSGPGGYVPEEEKLMIRGVRFGAHSRFQEQVAVSGKHITHEVIVEAMRRMRVAGPTENLTKTEVQERAILNLDGQGAMAMLAFLDQVASEMGGQTIFRGEVVADDHPRDYQAAVREAQGREGQLHGQTEELVEFLLMLERAGTDHGAAVGIVDKHVKAMVFDAVKHDPERAAIAFDAETGRTVQAAIDQRAAGNDKKAQELEAKALANAPSGGCGADSCGLETPKTQEEADEIADMLDAEDGDEILHDTERPCPHCGKLTVWYVFNDKKVNKGCTSCHTKELTKGNLGK